MAAFLSRAAAKDADFARGLTLKQGWRKGAMLEGRPRGFLSQQLTGLCGTAVLFVLGELSHRLGIAEGERAFSSLITTVASI